MLQQTTVPAVLPYYAKWIRQYPDIENLSRTPLQKVLTSWQGLGYYQRARNLHRAARIIQRRHGGRFPNNEEALRAIPGIGPYTAAAVLSIAFGLPLPVLEANARRVLMRLYRLPGKAGAEKDRLLRPLIGRLFSRRNPAAFNQAIMELGALVCRPRNPLCASCPVTPHCSAYAHGEQEIIPTPRVKRVRRVQAVLAVVERAGRFLIQKRPSAGLLAGLWEFPGGKVRKGESREQALCREVREELGADIGRLTHLVTVRHAYTQFQVTLHAFGGALKGRLRPGHRPTRWVSLRGLRRYPFPSGSAKIIDFLKKRTTIKTASEG